MVRKIKFDSEYIGKTLMFNVHVRQILFLEIKQDV